MKARSVEGKVAVVTGAASGIGRALALELTRRGARVAGSDVDEAGLKETAALCGESMHAAVVDVGDRDAVLEYAEEVVGRFGVVHQLYNNAGIAFRARVVDSDWADYERVLRVNLNGVIICTQAFLRDVIASGDGHVTTISSLNGYLAQAGLSHYCTSKFAVRGFTETLRAEMLRDRQPVQVSVVHPGGVATEIAMNALVLAREAGHVVTARDEALSRAYSERFLRMDPQQAARIIVDGVERGRARIRVGSDAVAVDRLVRLMPATAVRLAAAAERGLSRMGRA